MKLKHYLVLLAFLLWGAGSTYWYVCKIKGFCPNNNKQQVQTTPNPSDNALQNAANQAASNVKDLIYYPWGETKPVIADSALLAQKIKKLLEQHVPGKKLKILVPYYPNEAPKDGLDKFAQARAKELKQLLANYIDTSLIITEPQLIHDSAKHQIINGFNGLYSWVSIPNKPQAQPIPQENDLEQALISQVQNLKVYFPPNSAHEIGNPKLYKTLDQLAKFLKQHPDYKLELTGYTDSLGSAEANKRLGLERAQRIAMLLIQKGVDKHQLIIKSGGESNPVADNSTPEGRQKNRRVEFKLIH